MPLLALAKILAVLAVIFPGYDPPLKAEADGTLHLRTHFSEVRD